MPDRLQMYNLLLRLGTDRCADAGLPGRRSTTTSPLRQQRAVWNAAAGRRRAQPHAGLRLALHAGRERPAEGARGDRGWPASTSAFRCSTPTCCDFSLRLPADYKLHGLKLRWFFKEALRGFLPDEIIAKKKQGFGLPFGVWALRHDGAARAGVRLARQPGAPRHRARRRSSTSCVDRRLAEHPGYYGEMVWILMMLEQWLQQHRLR